MQPHVSSSVVKSYVVQLVEDRGFIKLRCRWGNVGGCMCRNFKSFSTDVAAIAAFKKKFKAKTNLDWEQRTTSKDRPSRAHPYQIVAVDPLDSSMLKQEECFRTMGKERRATADLCVAVPAAKLG